MSDRLVVHLDTNFLSLLAKVGLKGEGLKRAEARVGEEALDFFNELVRSRVAIFPDSWTRQHEIELKGDRRFDQAARDIAGQLSRGVDFHAGTHILSNQMRNLFVAYLDETAYVPTWHDAFAYDPRGPIPRRVERAALDGGVVTDEQGPERRRSLKRLFVEYHQDRAQHRRNLPLTYEELKTVNARTYAEIIALGPRRRRWMGETLDFADIVALNATAGALSVAQERGDQFRARFWEFVTSDTILQAPAIDIWASIETSIELDEPSRGWEGGDQYDLQALSDVLPYCDVVFCDRNMKGILGRRKVDSRYGTRVYSIRDFEKFREDANAGAAGPLGAMDPRVAPAVERWQRVTDYLVHVARLVDPERWGQPSPDPGWTYKDLLAHLATGYTVRLFRLHSLLKKGRIASEPDADHANAESIAKHRDSSPEALVEEMIRQRSEVGRLMRLLQPEQLEARTIVRRLPDQAPQETPFFEALQHWHEHDLQHAPNLAPILPWPLTPPQV